MPNSVLWLTREVDHDNVSIPLPNMAPIKPSCDSLSPNEPAYTLIQLCHATEEQRLSVVGMGLSEMLAIKTQVISTVQKCIDEKNYSDTTVAAIASLVCNEVGLHDCTTCSVAESYFPTQE